MGAFEDMGERGGGSRAVVSTVWLIWGLNEARFEISVVKSERVKLDGRLSQS